MMKTIQPVDTTKQLPKYLNPNFHDNQYRLNRNPLALLEETCRNIGKELLEDKSKTLSKTTPLQIDTRENEQMVANYSSQQSRKRPLSNSTASPVSNASSNLSKRSKINTPSSSTASPQKSQTSVSEISGADISKFSHNTACPSSQISFIKENKEFQMYYKRLMENIPLSKVHNLPPSNSESQMAYLHHLHTIASQFHSPNIFSKIPTSCPCYYCQSRTSPFYQQLANQASSASLQQGNQVEARFCIFCGKQSANSVELLQHLKTHVNEPSSMGKFDAISPVNTSKNPLPFWNNVDYPIPNFLAHSHLVKPRLSMDPFLNPYMNCANSGLNSIYNPTYA